MFGQIDEIKNLAFKYSKQQLGRMVQMGMIDPQKAMMAGMMRDRVAKEDTKPPTTTVAQDVLGAAPQVQQPAQPQQMGMPQQAPAPQAPAQMAATGGITSLPVQEQDYAGGGIVAFAGDEGSLVGYNEYGAPPDLSGDDLSPAERLATLFDSNYRPYRPPVKAVSKSGQIFPSKTDAAPEPTKFIDATTKTALPPPLADKAPAGPAAPRLPALNRPSGKIDIQEYSAATPKTIDEILAEQQGAYKKQGLEDPYKGLMEKEEGKRAGLGKRKEEAKGEFLMNLGLGLTQAKRGQEFAALGAGAKEGLASYKDAMKDVRATEEKLDDRINAYKLAEYQAKKTGTDAAIAKRDSMLDKVEAAKIKNIDARNTANAEQAKIQANIYSTETAANTARYVAGIHANTQKEMNTLVKQGQLDAKVAQVLLTSEKNFMDANAASFIGKPDELARAARAHAIEAAKVYMPGSTAANSSMAPAPVPTADIYQKTYGITPTR
jgi:hypothetical protein